MTVSRTYLGERFEPDQSRTYNFLFQTVEADDVLVAYVYSNPFRQDTLNPSEYTVTLGPRGERLYEGGQVVINDSFPDDADFVLVYRRTDITQLSEYNPYGPFPANTLEFNLDKLTLINQEQKEEIDYLLSVLGGLGQGGEFVSRLGDSMTGDLQMLSESAITLFEDTGSQPRLRLYTLADNPPGTQRSGLSIYDVNGNERFGDELISIRTESRDPQNVANAAVVVQRSESSDTAGLDFTGLIGANNIRLNDDHGMFFLQGEQAGLRLTLGTAWNQQDEGLNSMQLWMDRPGVGSQADFVRLGDDPRGDLFVVDKDGNVDIAGEYRVNGTVIGGVGEAPEDGSTYGRRDGAWVDIADGTGVFLPVDGTVPMNTGFDIHGVGKPLSLYEDAGTTERIRIGWDETFDDGNFQWDRAEVLLYGKDGSGGGTAFRNQNVALYADYLPNQDISRAAVVVSRGDANSPSYGDEFNMIIGHDMVKDGDTAQFVFQGDPADFGGDPPSARRAWFGTNWELGNNPNAQGLSNIQLYIDRPTEGVTGFIDCQVAGQDRFTVTKDGGVTAAGGVYANGNGGAEGQIPGFAVSLEADQTEQIGYVRSRDITNGIYRPLRMLGDILEFQTTAAGGGGSIRTNMRLWQNPASVTIDEFALFNKTQFRIYADQAGTIRTFETYGTGIAQHGARVIQTGLDWAGIEMECDNSEHRLELWTPGSNNSFGVRMYSRPGTAASEIEIDGFVKFVGTTPQKGGLRYNNEERIVFDSEDIFINPLGFGSVYVGDGTFGTQQNFYVSGMICYPANDGGAIDMNQNIIFDLRTFELEGTSAANVFYVNSRLRQLAEVLGADPAQMAAFESLLEQPVPGPQPVYAREGE